MSQPNAPHFPVSIDRRRRGRARLVALAAAVAGVLMGLGTFTFVYGKGASYLTNDPASCANCHIMQEHYDSWLASSHTSVATCNDCHLGPHPIGKWITKADNGFFHSLAFTTGRFPDPLRIKPRNRAVTQRACLKCHTDIFHPAVAVHGGGDGALLCVHCHTDVGHSHR
jgi:cytochrome c nitrite reductase small subunit